MHKSRNLLNERDVRARANLFNFGGGANTVEMRNATRIVNGLFSSRGLGVFSATTCNLDPELLGIFTVITTTTIYFYLVGKLLSSSSVFFATQLVGCGPVSLVWPEITRVQRPTRSTKNTPC